MDEETIAVRRRIAGRAPGQRLARLPSVWRGDDSSLRCGRSGDVVTMVDDLGIPSRLSVSRPRS